MANAANELPKATPRVATRVAAAETALNALIYVRDPDSEGILRRCLADLGVNAVAFTTGGIENAIADLAHRASPRLLVVDIGGTDDPIARVGELAQVCEPSTGVIVIGDINDVALYRGLKGAGIVEYYFKPLVSNLVSQTCSAILTGATQRQASTAGKLVVVMGVRGGAGATSIATWAAWHLAEMRHRHVLLFDLDLSEGDTALQLDVIPNNTLREALEQPERVDALFLERGVIHVTPRLDLLASLGPLSEVTVCREEAVIPLVAKLLNRYRYVFVDLPPSLAPQLLHLLHMPSVCILVSEPSLVAARDVARWREIVGANTLERQTLHIVNKAGAYGSLPIEEFTKALGHVPDVVIPYDREIGAASLLGAKGLTENGALGRALAPVFKHIAGETIEENRSLFHRIFG